MSNTITEFTSESWASRLMSSIKNVLIGLVLFLASFVVLFWNEGNAVRVAKSLDEGAAAAITVDVANVDPVNELKIVHLSGLATSNQDLADPDFGVSATKALRLERIVEMYQWKETAKTEEKKRTGGRVDKETTYTYSQEWSAKPINSADFKDATKANPPMPFDGRTFAASPVTVGAFDLPASMASEIRNAQPLPVTADNLAKASPAVQAALSVDANKGIYITRRPAATQPEASNSAAPATQPAARIGDIRVTFRLTPPTEISLAAQQTGKTFQPYVTKVAGAPPISEIRVGRMSKEQLFAAAQAANVTRTWIIRFVGLLAMFIGLIMITSPIAVFGDVVPLIGSLLRGGAAIFAGLVSIALSLLTISVAWLFYRPVLGALLLAVSVGAIVLLKMRTAKPKAAPQPAMAGQGPAA